MTMNEEVIQSMEQQIQIFNKKIDHFQEKIANLPRAKMSKMNKVVIDLKQKKDKLDQELRSFKEITENAYKDVQIGVEMAWDDLNIAYDSAKERFEAVS